VDIEREKEISMGKRIEANYFVDEWDGTRTEIKWVWQIYWQLFVNTIEWIWLIGFWGFMLLLAIVL
jgi:hypothetical protein